MGKYKNPFFVENFIGFFDNYKAFVDPETNELEIKYICEDCKTIMTKEQMLQGQYSLKVTAPGGTLAYHTAKFWCRECALKRIEESASHE